MSIPNGTHGELRWKGVKIAKVRNASIDKSRATLETTGIGDLDDTYAYGKRTTNGSCTLLYKQDDAATVALMNRILDDTETPDQISLIIRAGSAQGTIGGDALINQQSEAVTVGDNTSVNVSFVISGKPSATF
jgi:hypothetical protein